MFDLQNALNFFFVNELPLCLSFMSCAFLLVDRRIVRMRAHVPAGRTWLPAHRKPRTFRARIGSHRDYFSNIIFLTCCHWPSFTTRR